MFALPLGRLATRALRPASTVRVASLATPQLAARTTVRIQSTAAVPTAIDDEAEWERNFDDEPFSDEWSESDSEASFSLSDYSADSREDPWYRDRDRNRNRKRGRGRDRNRSRNRSRRRRQRRRLLDGVNGRNSSNNWTSDWNNDSSDYSRRWDHSSRRRIRHHIRAIRHVLRCVIDEIDRAVGERRRRRVLKRRWRRRGRVQRH